MVSPYQPKLASWALHSSHIADAMVIYHRAVQIPLTLSKSYDSIQTYLLLKSYLLIDEQTYNSMMSIFSHIRSIQI